MEERTTLADLNIGESAEIAGFSDKKLSLKLLEMGCLPGAWVKLNSQAPLGDPITICIGGSHVSMRRSEASTVLVQKK